MPARSRSRSRSRTQVRKRSSRKGTRRSSRKISRKGSRRGSCKGSRTTDTEKMKRYLRNIVRKQIKYGKGNSTYYPSVWIHPVTGNQVKFSDKAKRLLREVRKEFGY
jgi:hypothetical protein